MPIISVIIPCFNVAPYLEECIESVISQSFKDIEIICIDDCSTDNTYELLCKYESYDLCRIVRHEFNKGPGAARNLGISLATGDYLFFLDSDDLLAPNTLAALYDIALETDAEIVSSQIQYFDEIGKREVSYSLKGTHGYYQFSDYKLVLLGRVFFAIWGRLYKRSFFIDRIGLIPEGVYFEDVIPFLRGQILAEKLAVSQEVGILYRQRLGSASKLKVNVNDIKLFLIQAYKLFNSELPLSFREDFLIFIGNTYSWYVRSDELKALYLTILKELNYTDFEIDNSVNIKRLRRMQGKKVSLLDRVRSFRNYYRA